MTTGESIYLFQVMTEFKIENSYLNSKKSRKCFKSSSVLVNKSSAFGNPKFFIK